MRIFSLVLLVLLCSFSLKAQNLRERALKELTSLVEHPFELLGKTESAILKDGRPSLIKGGDSWQAVVTEAGKGNDMGASKAITISTGCGDLMLVVSERTGQVYVMTFMPNEKSELTEAGIREALKSRLQFDQQGNASYRAANYTELGVSLVEGALVIMAFTDNGTAVRFAH